MDIVGGNTPLFGVRDSSSSSIKLIHMLLAAGAYIHERNDQGLTLLQNYHLTFASNPIVIIENIAYDIEVIIENIFQRWSITMAIILLQELYVYHQLDAATLFDLWQYLGLIFVKDVDVQHHNYGGDYDI